MATKRPVGVLLLGILFLLWGVRCVASAVSVDAGFFGSLPPLGLAFLTLATAYGLLQTKWWLLRVYTVWVGAVIVAGFVMEFSGGTPVLVIVVWTALITVLYVAVGLYLRDALQQPG